MPRIENVLVVDDDPLAREFLAKSAGSVKATLRGTRLVVPSEFLREVFAGHGVHADIIPNVVDTATFRPADPPRAISR